jgi:mannose-6-phosphate isomerase-like protein (cupin superfamily)
MPNDAFDLTRTYVQLHDDGAAARVEVTATFWKEVMAGKRPELAGGRLVGVFPYEADWTSAEMHPAGEEIVFVLSGAITLILQEPGGDRAIALAAGQGTLVPKGVWHTARVHTRGHVLHVTPGTGTQHRPL